MKFDLQQTLCSLEDEKSTTDKKIEEREQTGGLNHPSFILPFLSDDEGDGHHVPCFLSVYPATNGFARTWDLRSNYHVSLIGAPIIPLFTPNTLVHNKQGKALILFLRRVDYPYMEVGLYYCCVNCSIWNNGKFECNQTLLVVIVHLIGLSNTLRFWWGHIDVYCVWVTICWWKLNSKCFSLHLIYSISQCQQCKQFIARCYLHLWWYFLAKKWSKFKEDKTNFCKTKKYNQDNNNKERQRIKNKDQTYKGSHDLVRGCPYIT